MGPTRDHVGALIARALDLGLGAELIEGHFVIKGPDWRWAGPNLEMTTIFLEGYANGLADQLQREQIELRNLMRAMGIERIMRVDLGVKPPDHEPIHEPGECERCDMRRRQN